MSSREQGSLRPPLPAIVRQSLSRRRLAYLGTVTSSSAGGGVPCPHLSLMRFTYLPEEDAILMSTNVYTKKYDMLSAGAAGGGDGGEGGALVALLVHDFADSSHFSSHSSSSSSLSEEANNSGGGMYSITLNGTCSVVKDGKDCVMISCSVFIFALHALQNGKSDTTLLTLHSVFFLSHSSLSPSLMVIIMMIIISAPGRKLPTNSSKEQS